jgi:hypothetical protein
MEGGDKRPVESETRNVKRLHRETFREVNRSDGDMAAYELDFVPSDPEVRRPSHVNACKRGASVLCAACRARVCVVV